MTRSQAKALAVLVLGALLVWAAPLVGLWAAGRPLAPFVQFPPRARFVVPASFDWAAFALLSLPALAAIAIYAIAFLRAQPIKTRIRDKRSFPGWTWIGLVLLAAGWLVAWNAIAVPERWREQSFTALWLGYVIALNALAWRCSGRSLLTHATGTFLWLFPASAAFWWLFEYLNQFAGNWRYGGVAPATALDYFLRASVPFSTVLPAVASTWAWLRTFPRLEALALPQVTAARPLAWMALLAGALGLAFLPLAPRFLFPALWLAPILVLAGLQHLLLGETLFTRLARGDWRAVLQPALAALVCGLLWELWNSRSLAQWHYSLPFVQRFHVFEMPLLGYAGYLPFGVECALALDLLARATDRKQGQTTFFPL